MTLTPFACSVHTHSTLCDGKDSPETMAAAAYAAGVRYFGVSCHSHTPISADEGAVLPADMTAYRKTALRLREAYSGRMEVLLGLEWDSCADVSPEGVDYWIGSVHYQRGNGKFYAADWGEAQFSACRDELFGGDALAVAEGYFAQVAQVAAKKPTILGHLDLITKLNAGGRFFDEQAPRYRAAALAALHAADPRETLLEINTGGVARGYRETPYPALFLLREWRAMGGRIILTADAHSADTLTFGYAQASALAVQAGFCTSTLLTLSGCVDCPLR
ncbi:histidinol-phosphatase HisJ family protein [Oscillibacter sp.]|uniref:histidinol-phosphatase HisJ family protein n=1 Tax=Oscillibacter sp. TaxID=1945593 RepID=UPI0026055FC2|nr:histidinol-phosphatase HisJ family protein [Oscillibacter sp.]MDD3346221.1 histidinol-phosphatase HisJ family protein [Oscillibacter sp.]